MNFTTPRGDQSFEIADEWWSFCDAGGSVASRSPYYIFSTASEQAITVPIEDVQPPRRDQGVAPFKKYKLIPILLTFQSPECELPPVEVVALDRAPYRYEVINGFHRYYASVAVGYARLPVVVRSATHAL